MACGDGTTSEEPHDTLRLELERRMTADRWRVDVAYDRAPTGRSAPRFVRTARVRASWTLLVVSSVALGACGGSVGTVTVHVIASSSIATTKAGTAKLEIRNSGGETGVIEGEVDFAHDLVQLSGTETANGTVESVGEIITPNAIYIRGLTSDVVDPALPGKPWVEFDTPSSAPQALSPFVGGDPTAILRSLGATASEVHKVGSEAVRGVSTTHYTVRVTLGAQSGVFGVWIDQAGLLRRLQGPNFGSTTPGSSTPSTATIEFFDFGTPVSITIPPADQTSQLNGVLQGDFPQPNGAWQATQHGADDGITWSVFVAAATKSGHCITVQTTPQLSQVAIELAGNGEETSGTFSDHPYLGRQADCAPGPNNDDLDLLAPLLAGDTQTGAGPHFIAGLATAGAHNITVHLSDGSSVAARIGNGTYIAWWSGPRTFAQLTFDYPGGAGLACDNGGGDNTDPLDGISCSGSMSTAP